jgi:predicted MFS family arabinose efflux permease
VFAGVAAACGLAGSLEALGLLRLVAGGAAAAVFPMGLAYIGDSFAYRDRPGAISALITAGAGAQVVSLALGGILAGFVSWRAAFFLSGALAVLVVVALFRVRAEAPAPVERDGTLAAYRGVLSIRGVRVIVGLAFVEGMLLFGGLTYLGAYLRDTWGLPYPTIGLLLSAYGVATLATGRLLGWSARRFDEPTRFVVGGLASAAGYGLVVAIPSWELAPPCLAILGVGYVAAHSVLQTRATELAPRARGTAIALFACNLFVGGSLGTAALGEAIATWGYRSVLGVVAALLVLFAIAGRAALRPIPPRTPA